MYEVLTIERHRPRTFTPRGSEDGKPVNKPRPPFHVSHNGRPSEDWTKDQTPEAPRDVLRLLGDNTLCIALANAAHLMTCNHDTDLNTLITLMYTTEQKAREIGPPRETPKDIPQFSDYSLPVIWTRRWGLHERHFRTVPEAALPSEQLAARRAAIKFNKELLSDWVRDGLRPWVRNGYTAGWVKDSVAREVFRQECYRILATGTSMTDPTGRPMLDKYDSVLVPDAVASSI